MKPFFRAKRRVVTIVFISVYIYISIYLFMYVVVCLFICFIFIGKENEKKCQVFH